MLAPKSLPQYPRIPSRVGRRDESTRGVGGGDDGAGGGNRGAVAAVPRADPGGARALAASLEAAAAEAARGPHRWLSPQISTYCT